jgi:predicted AAA+ superfamily ATPase
MRRSLVDPAIDDLQRKMVFVSGPRQVGKTTLARQVLEVMSPDEPVYLTWDRADQRALIRTLGWSRSPKVVALDEVHKYARWKTLLKGFHDTEGTTQRLLVTGSARLDLFRKGGDSLLGRYLGLRLHPLSIGELARNGGPLNSVPDPSSWASAPAAPNDHFELLNKVGGFPEPALASSERQARRWRLAHRERVLREDVRDLTLVRDVSLLEQLVDLLVERVASPLSVSSLRRDLEVDHKTILRWLEILERLYVVFRVPPFAGSLARTLRKEPKVYFWDWAEAAEDGARFENLIASHLLKLCHWLSDVEGHKVELFYVRDRERREVDFLLVKGKKPWVLVESKLSEVTRSPSLDYFQQRLSAPFAFQVVAQGQARRGVVPATRFFSGLP